MISGKVVRESLALDPSSSCCVLEVFAPGRTETAGARVSVDGHRDVSHAMMGGRSRLKRLFVQIVDFLNKASVLWRACRQVVVLGVEYDSLQGA